jgi:hypothetical protein
MSGMRWQELFADLEGEFAEAERADHAAEVADRSRAEYARVRLVDRLRAGLDLDVTVTTAATGRIRGRLESVGAEWLLLVEANGRQVLLPLAHVLAIGGLSRQAAEPGSEGRVAARLGLRHALRGLARDRTPVAVVLTSGDVLTGTIDRVGEDFVELAEHPVDEPRRAGSVRAVRLLPLSALAAVRSR